MKPKPMSMLRLLVATVLIAGCAPTSKPPKPSSATTPTAALPVVPPPPFDWPAAAEQPGQTPTRHVSLLNFAWPADTRIAVDRKATITLGGSNQAPPNSQALTYVLTSMPVAGGIRIGSSDVKVVIADKKISERVKSAYNKSIAELGPSLVPSFLVTEQGKFLRVENLQQVRDDLSSMAQLFEQEQTAESNGSDIKIKTSINREVTDQSITAQVSGEWNSLVGIWSGVTIKDGTPFPMNFPSTIDPSSGATALLTSGTVQFVGLARCEPGDQDMRCVALELKMAVDNTAAAQAMITSATVNAPTSYSNKNLFKVDSASRDFVARIVTEPDSLRPHRAQLVERIRTKLVLLTNLPFEILVQQETLLTFRYLSR